MRPVRFIHTSDVHLDTGFSRAGFPSRLGDRKRESIRSTLRRILGDARREDVDFVLIAGDLFEHDRVTPDTVEFLKQQFAESAPAPIFIAPGNHDPYLRGSPYCEESWPGNVHIFRGEEFHSIELADAGVRVTGFGYNRSHIQERLFQKLPVLLDDRINVVVAHGSDVGRIPGGKAVHGPFSIEEIAGKNVRYCALGHYHQQRAVPNPVDRSQAWYCGIPEGRGWDEEGECSYLLVEIDGADTRVQGRPCNQYPLRTLAIVCEGFATREQIIDEIMKRRGARFDANTILRVVLTGAVDPRLNASFAEMEERLSGAALHIQWEDRTEPALDFASIAADNTLVGQFTRELNSGIMHADSDQRALLERVRLYGVQAMLGREVRLK